MVVPRHPSNSKGYVSAMPANVEVPRSIGRESSRGQSVRLSQMRSFSDSWTSARSLPSVDPMVGGEYYKDKSQKKVQMSVWSLACTVLFLLPWVWYRTITYQVASIQRSMEEVKQSQAMVLKNIDRKKEKLRELNEQLRGIDAENRRIALEMHARRDLYVPENSEYEKMREIEDGLFSRLDSLRSQVQRMDRRQVEDQFGKGPHLVEVTLKEPQAEENNISKFIIEMAPLDLMPHAVHRFLNMVTQGLWDGLSFVHRDVHSHVFQATPLDISRAERVDDRFHDAGLGKLAFAEYSPEYPHKAYTVGFAGKPGGPDFYVNTVDNTETHGPSKEGEMMDGESCFGTVVKGRDILDTLFLEDQAAAKVKLVVIDKIRVL